MPIDKIRSTESYAPLKRSIVKPKAQVRSAAPRDSITLTHEAKQSSDYLRIRDLAQAAPNLRAERMATMQSKLQDPAYPDEIAIRGLADSLLDHLSFL